MFLLVSPEMVSAPVWLLRRSEAQLPLLAPPDRELAAADLGIFVRPDRPARGGVAGGSGRFYQHPPAGHSGSHPIPLAGPEIVFLSSLMEFFTTNATNEDEFFMKTNILIPSSAMRFLFVKIRVIRGLIPAVIF